MQPQTKTKSQNASRVYAHKNGVNQIIAFGPSVLVTFPNEYYDGLGEFNNTAGNYYFQPIRAGYYLFSAQIELLASMAAGNYVQAILVNSIGVNVASAYTESVGVAAQSVQLCKTVHLIPTQRVTLRVTHTIPAGVTINGNAERTWFTVHRLS